MATDGNDKSGRVEAKCPQCGAPAYCAEVDGGGAVEFGCTACDAPVVRVPVAKAGCRTFTVPEQEGDCPGGGRHHSRAVVEGEHPSGAFLVRLECARCGQAQRGRHQVGRPATPRTPQAS